MRELADAEHRFPAIDAADFRRSVEELLAA
jgi:hypothetical protein